MSSGSMYITSTTYIIRLYDATTVLCSLHMYGNKRYRQAIDQGHRDKIGSKKWGTDSFRAPFQSVEKPGKVIAGSSLFSVWNLISTHQTI